MARHAVAVRGFTLAPDWIAKGTILRNMHDLQFADLEQIGEVRLATDAELATSARKTRRRPR